MSTEYEPRLTEPLQGSYQIREGQPVKLSCRFDAQPRADIQWLKDGLPIDFEALGISRDFKVCALIAHEAGNVLTTCISGRERGRLHRFTDQGSLSRRYRIVYRSDSKSMW